MPGTTDSALAAPRTAAFPYQLLADFAGGELTAAAADDVRRRLDRDPRWRAHFDSLAHLDAEREVAREDGRALKRFDAARASQPE